MTFMLKLAYDIVTCAIAGAWLALVRWQLDCIQWLNKD